MARTLFDINIGSIIGADSDISVGAKLYFFESDGVTEATTYTTPDDVTENANPLLTQADGRFAQQAWLESGEYVYVLTAPGGSPASPLFTGIFIIPDAPPSFAPALDNFLAGTSPLPIANGGTNATSAVNALTNLGGLALTGGTVTGNIVRSTKGVHVYWDTAALVNGGMFITPTADPDPTSAPGQIWFRY
ncbi:MAG: hypothetical protein V4657_07285 [Pseudomonadota bacterium]